VAAREAESEKDAALVADVLGLVVLGPEAWALRLLALAGWPAATTVTPVTAVTAATQAMVARAATGGRRRDTGVPSRRGLGGCNVSDRLADSLVVCTGA
jgi:hypothetical protein